MPVSTIDIYDGKGNLVRIEAYHDNGEHVADFLWDERDPQTNDSRVEFRKWVTRHLKNKGLEVHE